MLLIPIYFYSIYSYPIYPIYILSTLYYILRQYVNIVK